MKAEKRKAYLRKLPTGYIFPRKELEAFVSLHKLAIPVNVLIEYGNGCNWLTRQGKSFKTCAAFCNSWNGVYLEKMRKKASKSDKDLFSFFIATTVRQVRTALENTKNFC